MEQLAAPSFGFQEGDSVRSKTWQCSIQSNLVASTAAIIMSVMTAW